MAGEVKALAAQTAHATKQIDAQIHAIRNATGDAVGAVREVGAAIGQVESIATAIASAVEKQAIATREISGSVQDVTMATAAAAQSMDVVMTIAEQAGSSSQSVSSAAEDVGRTADTLRAEVNEFLAVVTAATPDERRRYQRVAGRGTAAGLAVDGQTRVQATIRDISRGGVALICNGAAPCGTEVRVDLPEGGSVPGRVVRTPDGIVIVTFRQDAATLESVDRTLDMIARRAFAQAA